MSGPVSSEEIGLEFIEALGLPKKGVTEIRLILVAGDLARVEVVCSAEKSSLVKVSDCLKKYNLVREGE